MELMDVKIEIESYRSSCGEIRGGRGCWEERKVWLQTQSRHHAKNSLRMLAEVDPLEEDGNKGNPAKPDAAICT